MLLFNTCRCRRGLQAPCFASLAARPAVRRSPSPFRIRTYPHTRARNRELSTTSEASTPCPVETISHITSHPLPARSRQALPNVDLSQIRGSGLLLQVLLPAVRRIPGAGLQMSRVVPFTGVGLLLHHALLGPDHWHQELRDGDRNRNREGDASRGHRGDGAQVAR